MRLHLALFLSFTALSIQASFAQIYRLESQHLQKVKVTVNGQGLVSQWGGGMNHPQFAQADLDHDGNLDLVVYEDFRGLSANGLRTFINKGTAGNPDYVYNPDYEYLFPTVRRYIKLIDYNNDKIPDLFHYGYKGVDVCDGYYNNQNRLTFKNCRELQYNYGMGFTNIPVNNGDIPAIVDVDNDGDLDILLYSILDNDLMQLYKNTCIEDGAPLADFKLKLKDNCWGKMYPTYHINRQHEMGMSCGEIPFAPPGGGGGSGPYSVSKTTGAGSHCIAVMDVDADGDYDLFDGNQTYAELQLVYNGMKDLGIKRDTMIAQDTMWQHGGVKVEIPYFPVAYPNDVDGDSNTDLLISPNYQTSEDVKCVWYYKNTGTPSAPAFTYQTDDFIVKDMIDAGSNSYPVFYDFNKDGKKDLLIGSSRYDKASHTIKTQLSLYRNTSTGNDVSFEFVTNDVANVSIHNFGSIAPAIGDIDNDGLDELIIGKSNGSLAIFRNYAASKNLQPVWQLLHADMTTKFGTKIDVGEKATPCFYDIDKDGKKDLVLGGSTGYLTYLRNEGTQPQELKLVLETEKLGGVFVGTYADPYEYPGYSAPFIGRIDNTKTDYLLVGNEKGEIVKYGGVDLPYTPNMVYPMLDSPYSDIAIKGLYAAPVVADLDGDTTMMEMFIGNELGGLYYYRQIFNESVPETVAQNNSLNLYPNPATGILNIALNNMDMTESADVKVYNTTGQLMQAPMLKRDRKWIAINTENLPEGVYLCIVNTNGGRYSSVFVKQ